MQLITFLSRGRRGDSRNASPLVGGGGGMFLMHFVLACWALSCRGLLLAVCWVMCQSAAAQSTTTSAIGSYITLSGQVVGPPGSPSLGSIYGISSGDQVNWLNYYSSNLSSPYTVVGSQVLPANYSWINGSVIMPPNGTMQWSVNNNTTVLTAEPPTGTVVNQAQWTINPMLQVGYSLLSTSGSFSGTGDGFRLIPYKNNLYVVNHHSSSNFINCRMILNMQPCPLVGGGVHPGAPNGASIIGYSDSYLTPVQVLEGLNLSNGNLFVGVMSGGGLPEITCTNLDTLISCGVYPVPLGNWGENLGDLGLVGNQYFTLTNSGVMNCFDITSKSFCGNYKYPAQTSTYNSNISITFSGKVFFGDTTRSIVWCHDPSINQPCSGWTNAGKSMGFGNGLFPVLNPDGSPLGICANYGINCYTLNGQILTPTPGFLSFIQNARVNFDWSTNINAIYNSRIYTTPLNGVDCFDFATDARCPGWPLGSGIYTMTYATNISPLYPTCVLVLGDAAVGLLYDAVTGKSCVSNAFSGIPQTLDVNPANYYLCDPSKANVTAWDSVRIAPTIPWGSNGITGITVTLMDQNGTQLPAAMNPVRVLSSGSFTLDISDIPYTTYPHIRVIVVMKSNVNLTNNSYIGVDVTWKGGPFQVCFKNTAPGTPGCQMGTTLTVNSTEESVTTGVFKEQLTASMNMSPTIASSGYAAVSATTTARAAFSGAGQTQVLQGRWNWAPFSGELWSFPVVSTSTLSAVPNKNFGSNTLAGFRPMFSASPGGGVNGSMNVFPLTLANISPAQRSALGTNLLGVPDNLATNRFNYVLGTDGSFRPRPGGVMGPVVNSGPVVLTTTPQFSYSNVQHPGFSAYLADNTKARPNPLALLGSNDGALHAYSVMFGQLTEAWSFVPDVMLKLTPHYSDTTLMQIQSNPYFVDNIPMVANVDTGSASVPDWRAVAVITYGKGARAITALDVTYNNLAKGKGVLFEYTNTSPGDAQGDGATDLQDLGYIRSQPISDNIVGSQQIVELNDGRWAVLVGNGVGGTINNSQTARPVLYAFYLDGAYPRWRRFAVDALFSNAVNEPGLTIGNGLSTPRPVDVDGDGKVDIVYAGDLQGNLWRFDLTKVTAPKVTRLYQTLGGAAQPIQSAPLAVNNTTAGTCASGNSCWQLVFGTGFYLSPLENDVVATAPAQLVLSVLDRGDGSTALQGQLANQVTSQATSSVNVNYRTLTNSPVNYSSQRGWYLTLGTGEQVVSPATLSPTGMALITVVKPVTAIPASTTCSAASSWLYALTPGAGTTPAPVFDVNGDGAVTTADTLPNSAAKQVYPSAIAVNGQQFGAPTILRNSQTNGSIDSLFFPGLGQVQGTATPGTWNASVGAGNVGKTSGPAIIGDPQKVGRLSWREVY